MNRLHASLYPHHQLYYLRLIGEYARADADFTVIGIDQRKFLDINDLEAELKKLDVPIIKLSFVGDFIEYTIGLNFNQYRNPL
jgi:hypothetical protein